MKTKTKNNVLYKLYKMLVTILNNFQKQLNISVTKKIQRKVLNINVGILDLMKSKL